MADADEKDAKQATATNCMSREPKSKRTAFAILQLDHCPSSTFAEPQHAALPIRAPEATKTLAKSHANAC